MTIAGFVVIAFAIGWIARRIASASEQRPGDERRAPPLDAREAAEQALAKRFVDGELTVAEYEHEVHQMYGLANYDPYGDEASRKAVVERARFVAWTRGKLGKG